MDKRATLAGEIAKLDKMLEWKRSQLIHVDATLALFCGDNPDAIPPIKAYKRVPLFKQGELAQLVREALRRGGKPMLLSEVVDSVVKELGHGENALPALRHRVRASLQYLWRERKQIGKQGKGQRVQWNLAAL